MNSPNGEQFRSLRQRRHLRQRDLATEAEISTKHHSSLEIGRTKPSREMVLHMSQHLGIPLRHQNTPLQAAGFAQQFSSGSLEGADMVSARRTIDLLLKAHEPFPAIAGFRHRNLVAANAAVLPLMEGASTWLTEPPVNVVRLSLHPDGVASNIVNYVEWKSHLMERLVRQFEMTADPPIWNMIEEFRSYPVSDEATAKALAG